MIQKEYQRIEMETDTIQMKQDWIVENGYKEALCKTHTFVFECDVQKNTFTAMDNKIQRIFGNLPNNYRQAYEEAIEICYPEDREDFKVTFEPTEIRRAWNRGEKKRTLECRIYTNSGGYHWFYCTLLLFGDERNRLRKLICCGSDRDQWKEKEEQVIYQASHDLLTDVWNWKAGQEMLDRYLKVDNGKQAAFVLIKINNFKAINDKCGEESGDQILCRAVDIMRKFVTEHGWVIRRNGVEFIMFLETENPERIRYILSQILFDFKTYLKIEQEDETVYVTASVGVSLYPKHGKTADRLYQCADYALQHSKNNGKNTYSLYERGLELTPEKEKFAEKLDMQRWEDFDDIIYMSDPFTYELYYMNRITREVLGIGAEDYKGRKCYEVIQGRSTPCPFCTKKDLKTGESCVFRHGNPKIQGDFFIKKRRYIQCGKEVHMMMAIKIDEME